MLSNYSAMISQYNQNSSLVEEAGRLTITKTNLQLNELEF
jgi:hypothetical protein